MCVNFWGFSRILARALIVVIVGGCGKSPVKVDFLRCYVDFCSRVIVVGWSKLNVTNF